MSGAFVADLVLFCQCLALGALGLAIGLDSLQGGE